MIRDHYEFQRRTGHPHDECKIPEFDLVGWSRGAIGVVTVARLLNDEGCNCFVSTDIGAEQKTFKPIPIRFLGLYDAVSQHFFRGNLVEVGKIPGNVKFSAALWRTKDLRPITPFRYIYPQARYLGLTVEKDFYLSRRVMRRGWDLQPYRTFKSVLTSHGDTGRHPKAAKWMINVARSAGVPFNQ